MAPLLAFGPPGTASPLCNLPASFKRLSQRVQVAQMEPAAQNGAAPSGLDFIRPHLRELAAYTPIGDRHPPHTAEAGRRTQIPQICRADFCAELLQSHLKCCPRSWACEQRIL